VTPADQIDEEPGAITPAASSQVEPTDVTRSTVDRTIPRTRVSVTYVALICGLVTLVVLLVFILENTRRIPITFFGATEHVPDGVALLLAAVAGALIIAVVGAARISQLRRRVRRGRR
jgi:uncharacterized integral membrane protein